MQPVNCSTVTKAICGIKQQFGHEGVISGKWSHVMVFAGGPVQRMKNSYPVHFR